MRRDATAGAHPRPTLPSVLEQPYRDAIAVGAATGAYGLSFGAVASAAGLSVAQASALSLLMFTGASQFAFIGVVSAGGGLLGAVVSAALLGARNSFYGLRLAELVDVRGRRRVLAAQLVIDESAAMAVARDDDPPLARAAFWATGLAVFTLWNLGTLAGALAAGSVGDPAALGLDAAAPAAFIALLAPRLDGGRTAAFAVVAALVALAATPVPVEGVPILLAAGLAIAVGLRSPRGRA